MQFEHNSASAGHTHPGVHNLMLVCAVFLPPSFFLVFFFFTSSSSFPLKGAAAVSGNFEAAKEENLEAKKAVRKASVRDLANIANAIEEKVQNDPLAREVIEAKAEGKKGKKSKQGSAQKSALGFNSKGAYSGADLHGEKLGEIERTDDGVIGFGHLASGDEIGATVAGASSAISFADGEFIAAPLNETPAEEQARKAKEAAARADAQRIADEAAAAAAATQEADRVAAEAAAKEAAAAAAAAEKAENARKMAAALEKDKAKMAKKMKVAHGQKEAELAAAEAKAAANKPGKVNLDAHFADMKQTEKEQADALAAAKKEKEDAISKVNKEDVDNAAKCEQIKDGTAAVAHVTAIGTMGEAVAARKQSIQIDEKYKIKQEQEAKAEQLRKEAEERAEKARTSHTLGGEAYTAEMDRIQKERDDAAAAIQAAKDAAAAKSQADIDTHAADAAAENARLAAVAGKVDEDDGSAAASAARAAEAAALVAEGE